MLKRWTKKRLGDTRVLIEKDFNARTGTKGGRIKGMSWEGETEGEQKSKDKKIKKEGKILCKFLTEQGWAIVTRDIKKMRKESGRMQKDEKNR